MVHLANYIKSSYSLDLLYFFCIDVYTAVSLFFAAATGASGCPFHSALAIASRPEVKAILAAFAAAVAAIIAWYWM